MTTGSNFAWAAAQRRRRQADLEHQLDLAHRRRLRRPSAPADTAADRAKWQAQCRATGVGCGACGFGGRLAEDRCSRCGDPPTTNRTPSGVAQRAATTNATETYEKPRGPGVEYSWTTGGRIIGMR